jgi:uncharacterized protein YyaL (SSP411 family)
LAKIDSFSNPQCAAILNHSFVPVIVDRDERPDIDAIYINYTQGVYQTAGWPLNLFLTPEMEPIYGDTYIPGPGSEHVRAEIDGDDSKNFLKVLRYVEKVWQEQETRCRREASLVTTQLRNYAAEGTLGTKALAATVSTRGLSSAPGPVKTMAPNSNHTGPAPSELDLDELETAYTKLAGTFDPTYGGFGLSPKHITPPKLTFLLRLAHFATPVQDVVGQSECSKATDMVMFTLRQIRDSSLRDHVGGQGFGRYSVTADWSIPNFERLVPDNALLLSLFVDAWLVCGGTKESEFYDVVTELGAYLTSPPICLPHGAFASGEASDSYTRRGDVDMREGAYHLWTRREFDAVVGHEEESSVAAAHWNVLEDGNVEPDQDSNDEFMNQNILRIARLRDTTDLSKHFGTTEAEVVRLVASAKTKLAGHREKERVRPDLDDKVITAYNGLVISALARGGAAVKLIDDDLGRRYLDTARKAAIFVKEKLWDEQEMVLYRLYHQGRGQTKCFADDYAFLINGLLDLFEATGDENWVQWSDALQGW